MSRRKALQTGDEPKIKDSDTRMKKTQLAWLLKSTQLS